MLPILVWGLLCLSEWALWVFPPNGFFFHRGHILPNLNYMTTTRGDLVANNIFVTPVPRRCRYATDQFAERNDHMPSTADFVLMGDSFAWGAGSSQEDTPAVQLSKLTGRQFVFTRGSEAVTGISGMERAAMLIRWQRPTQFHKMIYFFLDADLLEPPLSYEPAHKVKEIFENDLDYMKLNWNQQFGHFKKYIRDYSPHAILARKLKTSISKGFLTTLYHRGFIKRSSKTLDFLDHQGRVYGFMKIPSDVNEFSERNQTYQQTLNAFVALHHYAHERQIDVLFVIVPRKKFAYNQFVPTAVKIKGYGPGEWLYRGLQTKGIPTVFLHPVIFRAVEEEMINAKPAVYWSDDTHWGPYGIHLGMVEVVKKLLELKWL